MQNLTFTQKLLRQRSFLNSLLPLFALFLGLGAVNSANAQVTFSGQTIIVDQGNGNVIYPAATFNGTFVLVNQTSGSTVNSFDINGTIPVLNGGTVTATGTGTTTSITGANLTYQVFDASFNQVTSGTIALTPTTGTGNVRTFSLSNANISLLASATTAGTYYVGVSYNASYQKTGIPPIGNFSDPNTYYASFDVTGVRNPAPTLVGSMIYIAPNAGSNVTYNVNPSTPRPFQGADLSSSNNGGNAYDVNSGQLLLNGGSATTTESGPNVINGVVLYYRVRAVAGTPPAITPYQAIQLTQVSNVNGTRTFMLTTAQLNLIASSPVLTGTVNGNNSIYNLDAYFQASGTNTSTNSIFSITDPGNPNTPYTASFTVSGTPVAQTIWVGGINDNWFDAGNWSNGVPNAATNALVRDLGAGNTVPYPNIYSDYRYTTAANVLIYDNTGSGPAMCRNLTLGGTSQASRSIARLVVGRLKVYGDFNNIQDSYIQRDNTVIEFAGTNQNITGGSFVAVEISGGGTKFNAGVMNVTERITFINGILTTDITRPLLSLVSLADRAPTNNNNGAQLENETDHNYLRGFVRTTRQAVLAGETRTYGNMGMTLTFNNNNPDNVDVTRNTAESYTPLGTKYSTRRIFGVRPSNQQTNAGGLDATMIFHYQNIDTRGLGATQSNNIAEQNLALFLSSNSGNTFQQLGRDVLDTLNNNLTKNNVRSFATFTLGDINNPLPVRLTAFDAKRVGTDALITWQTASEVNSKGYEVQVSTNGTEYRTLAFVNSVSANTTSSSDYRYVDTESNKSGKRYYRLHQVDLDGKDAYFTPVVVAFDGKSIASELVAYPNPLKSGDQLHLATQIAAAGKGQVVITDMTGRAISQQSVDMTSGLNDFSVSSFGDLKSGIYMVRMTLPTGETKNLKVVKQ